MTNPLFFVFNTLYVYTIIRYIERIRKEAAMSLLQRDPQTLGERLHLVRNEHGITQGQAAQLLGVSRCQVTAYEHGQDVPLPVLVTFCEVLGFGKETRRISGACSKP